MDRPPGRSSEGRGATLTRLARSRVTGTAAMLAFAPAYAHSAIWKGLSWSTALKFVFDGIVYGLVMGAVFGWLWPAAA